MNSFVRALYDNMRPLLYTAGAAITAAAFYYYVIRGDRETRTEDTTDPKEPVCKKTINPTESLQDQVTFLEEKYQECVELVVELQGEKANLAHQIKTLGAVVQDLATWLNDTHKECQRERKILHILQVENNKMKKTLMQKEEVLRISLAEADETYQEIINQLESDKSDLTHQVETLREAVQDLESKLNDTCMVFLAEAKEKQQEYVESIAQLQCEKVELTHQVETLRGAVQDLVIQLHDSHRMCDNFKSESQREQETHNILQMENYKIKKTLMQKEEFLKVFLAEAEEKYQEYVESIAQLQGEKAELTHQVETLRIAVQDLGSELHDTCMTCDYLMKVSLAEELLSDQGHNFESQVMSGVCGVLGIHKTRATPWHPQSDSLVESFNHTLAAQLAMVTAKNQCDWDKTASRHFSQTL